MDKLARNDHPILEPIRRRWSPRAFDGTPVSSAELASLFEAARWAASAFNEQPWRWLVASRADEEGFAGLLGCLNDWNQQWAAGAGALALAVIAERFARNGKPNDYAAYDLGQACANLAIQAAGMDLLVHPMAGIEPEKARERFGIPEGFRALTGIAIGRPGDSAALPDDMRESELAPRSRKALSELVFAGGWERPHPLA